ARLPPPRWPVFRSTISRNAPHQALARPVGFPPRYLRASAIRALPPATLASVSKLVWVSLSAAWRRLWREDFAAGFDSVLASCLSSVLTSLLAGSWASLFSSAGAAASRFVSTLDGSV